MRSCKACAYEIVVYASSVWCALDGDLVGHAERYTHTKYANLRYSNARPFRPPEGTTCPRDNSELVEFQRGREP